MIAYAFVLRNSFTSRWSFSSLLSGQFHFIGQMYSGFVSELDRELVTSESEAHVCHHGGRLYVVAPVFATKWTVVQLDGPVRAFRDHDAHNGVSFARTTFAHFAESLRVPEELQVGRYSRAHDAVFPPHTFLIGMHVDFSKTQRICYMLLHV